MESINARGRRESGQVLILFLLAFGVLMGMVAMTIDVGFILQERRSVQNAADAAALAGLSELPDSPSLAVVRANEWATKNGYTVANGATVTVNTPYIGDANAIEVIIEVDQPFIFALALGLDSIGVSARAVASNEAGHVAGVALLILSPDASPALKKSGTSDIIINDGGIMVNSTSDTATVRTGDGNIFSDGFYYNQDGGWDSSGGSGSYSPEPLPVTDPMIDPMAGLTPPDPYAVGTSQHSGGTAADPAAKIIVSGDYVLRPGAYWGGIDIRSNANVFFFPGTYVMAGGGFSVTGSGTITGNGVFFYNTFDPENLSGDGDCKSVDLRGSADFFLTAPSDGDYADILFWQDVNCDAPFKHEGSGDFTAGIIYVPGAEVVFSGSGGIGTVQIIADTVTITGTTNLTINYGGFLDTPLPASYRLIE